MRLAEEVTLYVCALVLGIQIGLLGACAELKSLLFKLTTKVDGAAEVHPVASTVSNTFNVSVPGEPANFTLTKLVSVLADTLVTPVGKVQL